MAEGAICHVANSIAEMAVASAPIEFAGFSVSFSPFEPGRLAVASAANFGIVGNGRLHVFDTLLAPCAPPPPLCLYAPAARSA